MTIAVVTGTRPEIIKMYPIMKEFDSRSIDYKFIHTGQHYDYNLFLKFIEEFGIRKPDYAISIDNSNPVDQVALMIKEVGIILHRLNPTLVLLQGDTNSVLASALSALKSNFPIAHVESGLRSNDWRTVEEHNRRIVDHISQILFSPTNTSSKNLQEEHVYGEIHTVGNTVIDAINLCLSKIYNSDKDRANDDQIMFSSIGINPNISGHYILVTLHRSENVDDLKNLKEVLIALSESKFNYIFPVHPHTMKRMREFGLTKHIKNGIKIIESVGYHDFLKLLMRCRFVITDSGGIQEEITSPQINKRAIILRECTERPESVLSGHSVLCKIEHKTILENIEKFDINASNKIATGSPYGTGDSAVKIIDILEKKILQD